MKINDMSYYYMEHELQEERDYERYLRKHITRKGEKQVTKETKISVLAVSYDEAVYICTAPYETLFLTGDIVEVEGLNGFGTVLIADTMQYGSDNFRLLDDLCLIRKVLRRVVYKELDWSGYEEETNE